MINLSEAAEGLNVSQIEVTGLEKFAANTSVEEHTRRKREDSRQWLALIVVGSLAFIVVGSFVSMWLLERPIKVDDIVKIIEVLIAPVTGIVGAVTGFYFGESSRSPVSPESKNAGNDVPT